MMRSLKELWADGMCPILNGVMHVDGAVELVKPVELPRQPGTRGLLVTETKKIELFDEDECTHVGLSAQLPSPHSSQIVVCGETSWGGDGFVAVTDSADSLIWIALFDFANPFVSLSLDADVIEATNNLDETWRFFLSKPSNITICTPENAYAA